MHLHQNKVIFYTHKAISVIDTDTKFYRNASFHLSDFQFMPTAVTNQFPIWLRRPHYPITDLSFSEYTVGAYCSSVV